MTGHLPEWARTALESLCDPPDEDAPLGLVGLAADKLQGLLPGREPDRFAELIAYCSAVLDGPLKGHPNASRKVLEVRGVARAQTFEQSGDIGALRSGVKDLSAAVGTATSEDEASASANLAHALFRLGEQSGDLAMLRQSVDLFDALPPQRAADPYVGSTRATAAMTIGGVTGDRQMVERAVLDLQALIGRPDLDDAAKAVLEQNLAVSLLRNANQNRSARVYLEVLRHLAGRLRSRLRAPHAEMLRLVQAMARFEFAKLSNDRRELRRTELELARLLKVFAQEPRRRLELLHLVGQARFHRARSKQSIALMESAIASLEEALVLCGAPGKQADARRDRLFADLGYFSLQIAFLTNSTQRAGDAQLYFDTALRSITIERAPSLYIQVAKGLFELHYRDQAFAEAAAVAADIDRAVRFARADPRLTTGVVVQAPLEIIGIPERHALCLARLGKLAEASVVLENTRGQRLAAALERRGEREAELPPEARAALAEARIRLTDRLSGADEKAIRHTWEDYLTLRRKHGLDLGAAPRTAKNIAAAAPANGALVQLSFTPSGSMALIWTRRTHKPVLVELARNAWENIRLLLQGGSDGRSWIGAYERFLKDSENVALAPQAIRDWSDAIDARLSALWNVIFQSIDDALHALGLEPRAPLLICPPGALALLPLSAALNATGDALSDRWDVSIAPNTLAVGRDVNAKGAGRHIVCLHSPAGDAGQHLPLTSVEAAALKRLPINFTDVSDKNLSVTGALTAMRTSLPCPHLLPRPI